MPKLRKVRRSKNYNHNVNRKRLRNKLQKLPDITCLQIKNAWENHKSTKQNLAIMGLAYDANEIFKIPNIKKEMMKKMKNDRTENTSNQDADQKVKKFVPRKIEVAKELEAEAKAPRERRFRLPKGQVQFITYLLDKYGDDYKAMARDKKNYDQLTWRKIRSKINVFKNIPEQYAEYLVQKGEIILEDPTPLEETRKKIAEENFRKHCEPNKQKKKKRGISIWVEEDINNDEDQDGNKDDEISNFDTSKTLEDKNGEDRTNGKKKKLKLFADDDDEENRNQNKRNKKNVMKNSEKTGNKKDNEKLRRTVEVKAAKSKKQDDSESEELDSENDEINFKDLDDLSDKELSDDDILDDEDFVTDSDDDSDE